MKKFKVGEKYRVEDKYCPENGNVIQIVDVFGDAVRYKTLEGKHFGSTNFVQNSIFSRKLKPVKNECIVIYRKGDEVIALDKSTGEKAIAKCHPDDEFNFKIGSKVAFEKLIGEESLKVLNTRICITNANGYDRLTVGKIYEIKDGKFTDDDGSIWPITHAIRDMDDLKKYLTPGPYIHYCPREIEFVEVVE